MKKILEYADEKSLLLLDEYGRGTSEINGQGLMRTLIKCISNKFNFRLLKHNEATNTPISILSTNMTELLTSGKT